MDMFDAMAKQFAGKSLTKEEEMKAKEYVADYEKRLAARYGFKAEEVKKALES